MFMLKSVSAVTLVSLLLFGKVCSALYPGVCLGGQLLLKSVLFCSWFWCGVCICGGPGAGFGGSGGGVRRQLAIRCTPPPGPSKTASWPPGLTSIVWLLCDRRLLLVLEQWFRL